MAYKVISNVNARLEFLHRKNKCLTPNLRGLFCNTLIQPYFCYAFFAWYPNLSRKIKMKIQTSYSKYIGLCLQLDKMSRLSRKEFETIIWLPIKERYNQSVNCLTFKY